MDDNHGLTIEVLMSPDDNSVTNREDSGYIVKNHDVEISHHQIMNASFPS